MQDKEQTKSLSYFRQLADLLRAHGVSEEEIFRAIQSEMSDDMGIIKSDFPVTGIDLAGIQPKYLVPDTGSPPTFTPNPENTEWRPALGTQGYLSMPTPDPLGHVKTNNPTYDGSGSNINHTYQIEPYYTTSTANWIGGASVTGSEPIMGSSAGYNTQLSIPPWRYDVEQSQSAPPYIDTTAILPSGVVAETQTKIAKFVYNRKENCPICMGYDGKTYDLNDRTLRPIPPSEGLGYTNLHPNCVCTWQMTEIKGTNPIKQKDKEHIEHVNRIIGQKSRYGSLHQIHTNGKMFNDTTNENFLHDNKRRSQIREAIAEIRQDFGWLEDDYLLNAKKLAEQHGAQVYLIRAAEETITDHRGEGEPLRRLLDGTELALMSRTAVNKGLDINHFGKDFQTDGMIVDSEYVPELKQLQFIVIEGDPEINAAIQRGDIDAVSINGGAPRNETVEPCLHGCNDGSCEMCLVPRGVILGELDDIGVTWVVSRPFMWRGKQIPQATAGVKTTAIEPI